MIRTFEVKELDIPRSEILRYASIREETEETKRLVDGCIAEFNEVASYRACFAEIKPEKRENGTVSLGFAETDSRDFSKFLGGGEKTVLFAATAGIGCDRLIKKYSVIKPSRALVMSAVGSAAVEAFCDCISIEIAGTVRRFSPGYGDMPLTLQPRIIEFLKAGKYAGITVSENCLMIPSKSVTAFTAVDKL